MFDQPEEFIIPKVRHLNFEGSGDAQAKEEVLSQLLACIQAASKTQTQEVSKEMVVGEEFPLVPHLRHELQVRLKRPRKLEEEGVT